MPSPLLTCEVPALLDALAYYRDRGQQSELRLWLGESRRQAEMEHSRREDSNS